MKYILCVVMPNGYAFYKIETGLSLKDRKVAPISREICRSNAFDPQAVVDGNVYLAYHNLSPETIVKAYVGGDVYNMQIENPMNLG